MAAEVACSLVLGRGTNTNRILVIFEKGKWNFVTEHVKDTKGEKYWVAAIRGVKEETGYYEAGLAGHLGSMHGFYENEAGKKEMATVEIFLVHLLSYAQGEYERSTEKMEFMTEEELMAIPVSDLRFPELFQYALNRWREGGHARSPYEEVKEVDYI